MTKIGIKQKKDIENGFEFLVELDGLEYNVTLDSSYWQKLSGGRYEAEELVRKSFEFLLEREPKEAILREFNLKVISQYFPEYEETITSLIG